MSWQESGASRAIIAGADDEPVVSAVGEPDERIIGGRPLSFVLVDPYGGLSSEESLDVQIAGLFDEEASLRVSCVVGDPQSVLIPGELSGVVVSVMGEGACAGTGVRVGLPCSRVIDVPVVRCATVRVSAVPESSVVKIGRVALIDLDGGSFLDAEFAGMALPLEAGGQVIFERVPPGRYRVEWESDEVEARIVHAVDVAPGGVIEVVLGDVPEDPCYVAGAFLLGGQAVAGAAINISSSRWSDQPCSATLRSGPDGAFDFILPRGGEFDVWVDTPSGRMYRGVELLEGGFRELLIDIPGARLGGVVLDGKGGPVRGGELHARSLGDGKLGLGGGVIATTFSDDFGRFSFGVLPVGEYVVSIGGASSFRTGGAWNRFGAHASRVSLASDRLINIVMGAPASVCGQLVDPAGVGDKGLIYLRRVDGLGGWKRAASSRRDGSYCCEFLGRGDYYLFAVGKDQGGMPLASIPRRVPASSEGVSADCGVTELHEGHSVSVSVVDSGGVALPSRVSVFLDLPGGELELPLFASNGKGRFLTRYTNLPLGDYAIRAQLVDGSEHRATVTCEGIQRDFRIVIRAD